MNELHAQILTISADSWFKNPAGITAIDLARKLNQQHEAVRRAVEELAETGYGSLNRDAEFVQLSIDPENPGKGFTQEPIRTHVFFPAKKVLSEAYYKSDLAKSKLPEYCVRLHLGAHQIGLVVFDEEVLSRYFDHPELYKIEDTSAGGEISAKSEISEDRHTYVRYGKCNLQSGRVAVTAIYKDLAAMGSAEQRYWHAHELEEPELDKTDKNFQIFLSRTYDGAWVEFPDPIGDLLREVEAINGILAPNQLFTRTANVHLRMPVEQTYKAYCDSASELYKVVGPDALSQATLKSLLQQRFGLQASDFIHKEFGRALSSIQLLTLLESKLLTAGELTAPLKVVSELRIAADHKILEPDSESQSYSTKFAKHCKQLTMGIANMRNALLGGTNV